MLRNYLKIALRTLFRNKLYTVLNYVPVLVLGSPAFADRPLYFDELTFDQQHSKVPD